MTTTSTGAGAVVEWFEWWNAIWRLDVEIVNVTGALAAVSVAGPNARELMTRLTDLDVSSEGFGYLGEARAGRGAHAPPRIGFVGEVGYELHFEPLRRARLGRHPRAAPTWGQRNRSPRPQRILRLEKMHILIGQDTDSESNVLEASMPWIAKLDKDDFVGKWSLEHVLERGFREQLVGFETESGVVPLEGGQIVVDGRPGGRVTSARWATTSAGRSGWPGCRPTSRRRTPSSRSRSTAPSRRRACACGPSSTRTRRLRS